MPVKYILKFFTFPKKRLQMLPDRYEIFETSIDFRRAKFTDYWYDSWCGEAGVKIDLFHVDWAPVLHQYDNALVPNMTYMVPMDFLGRLVSYDTNILSFYISA